VTANATIRFLARFCREHPLDEKIFVCPTFVAGRQIGEALARETGSWINLRFVTPWTLASEVLERGGGAGARRPMTSSAELALTDRLARELHSAGELEYLGRAGVSPGLVHALHRAVRDLRLDGRTSADIRPGLFLVERKGRELALLVGRYERALDADGLLDSAALLDGAIRAAASAPSPTAWTMCLSDVRLSRRETDFVRTASGDRLVLVPGDPVFGLDRPRHFWPAPGPAGPSEAGRLSWLFAPREAPRPDGAGRIDIFRALGPANECREVLRRLRAGKIPFDNVEILAPPGSVHPTVFHLLAARTGLPVTFGEGIPVSFTSPGRLFFGLVDWLGNDFSSAHFGRLVGNGDLVLPLGASGTPLPARTACRHLRSALIGWGRDRYAGRLAALRDEKAAELDLIDRGENGDDGEIDEVRRADLATAVAEIDELAAAVGRLLAVIPRAGAADGYDFQDLCAAFIAIVKHYGRADAEPDRKAREALLARLEEVRAEGRFPALPLEEALALVRAAGSELRVGASPPLPGRLHVAGFSSGGYSGRPVTFVVGLDEATFPGRGLQDPILLDQERAALSDSLPTSADGLLSNLFGLAAVLASLRGRVVLSYPSYDVVEGRESFPSSAVLQGFRLERGDADLDYGALDRELAEAAGFLPGTAERAFDELDWWLDRLAGRDPAPDGASSIAANFPDLAAGLAAAAARAGGTLTPYEGIVDIGPLLAEVDPVAGRKAVMSATRLELLAKCPFAYFLRHVLKVRPPEEVEFDRSRWLDPLQRGSLVHEILCAFMTDLGKRGEAVAAARHAGLLNAIAGELIARTREEIPPPSDWTFESERKDMLETLGIFLTAEEGRDERGEPLEFEKTIRKETIELGEGRSFLLSGSIDRVDRLGEDTWRVLDYKTGSASDYEELVEFGRGQKIQHALYAVALEGILARERGGGRPRVTRSGYLFPSRRGEGLERIIKNFDRDRLRSLLNDLLLLLKKGYFIAGPEAKCKYCDYAPVCVSGGPEGTKSKKKILLELLGLIEEKCAIAGIRTGGGDIETAAACGGDAGKARKRIEADLGVFEAYDKLGEYK
jgi:RecB family exonuclease